MGRQLRYLRWGWHGWTDGGVWWRLAWADSWGESGRCSACQRNPLHVAKLMLTVPGPGIELSRDTACATECHCHCHCQVHEYLMEMGQLPTEEPEQQQQQDEVDKGLQKGSQEGDGDAAMGDGGESSGEDDFVYDVYIPLDEVWLGAEALPPPSLNIPIIEVSTALGQEREERGRTGSLAPTY